MLDNSSRPTDQLDLVLVDVDHAKKSLLNQIKDQVVLGRGLDL